MERLADFSLLCVSGALVVALISAPPSLPPASVSAAASPAPVPQDVTTSKAVNDGTIESRPVEARPEIESKRGQRAGPWAERLGHSPRAPQPELTPEFIDVCLAVARDVDEAMATRLWEMRKDNPDELRSVLQRSRRLLSLAELSQRDPDLYNIKKLELATDANVKRLGRDLRQAIADDRADDVAVLEEQLLRELEMQWVFQFKARDEYICRLQDVVQQMEQQLEHDRLNRTTIIQARLKDSRQEPQPLAAPRRTRAAETPADSPDRRPRGRGRARGGDPASEG